MLTGNLSSFPNEKRYFVYFWQSNLICMSKIIFTVLGWTGVVLCTLGYLLLSIKVLRAESWLFQMINILGGLCLAAAAVNSQDLPNAAANVLWMFIGMYALGRQLRNR